MKLATRYDLEKKNITRYIESFCALQNGAVGDYMYYYLKLAIHLTAYHIKLYVTLCEKNKKKTCDLLVRPGSSSENVRKPLLISSVRGAKILEVAVWGLEGGSVGGASEAVGGEDKISAVTTSGT